VTCGQRTGVGLLAACYALAGVGHFVFVDAVVRIVPAAVPFPRTVVIATGVCELFGAVGLTQARWRPLAGRLLALYALCVWPANVRHALLDLGASTGLPIWYHLPRLAAQPLLIGWAWWAARVR